MEESSARSSAVAGGFATGMAELWLARAHDERTALLVERMVTKALAVADWVAVLGRGSVVTAGTSAEVKADGAVAAAYLGVAAHG